MLGLIELEYQVNRRPHANKQTDMGSFTCSGSGDTCFRANWELILRNPPARLDTGIASGRETLSRPPWWTWTCIFPCRAHFVPPLLGFPTLAQQLRPPTVASHSVSSVSQDLGKCCECKPHQHARSPALPMLDAEYRAQHRVSLSVLGYIVHDHKYHYVTDYAHQITFLHKSRIKLLFWCTLNM